MIKRLLIVLSGGFTLFLVYIWLGGGLGLGFFREELASLVSEKVHRHVEIKGEAQLHFTPAPVLLVTDLEIPNPGGFPEGTFLRLHAVRFVVRLLPFFAGKLHISELTLADAEVHLIRDRNGQGNWLAQSDFGSSQDKGKREDKDKELEKVADDPPENLADDSLVIDSLALNNMIVIKNGSDKAHSRVLQIDCTASLLAGQPFRLNGKGSVRESPFSLELELASLGEFHAENRIWMKGTFVLPGGKLDLNGQMDIAPGHKWLGLRLTFKGANLAQLNTLLRLDLPPLADYQIQGNLFFSGKQAELSDFLVRVGDSSLTGTVEIDTSGSRPRISIDLYSEQIQLDNIFPENWSWFKETQEDTEDSHLVMEPGSPTPGGLAILSPYDGHFRLVTEKVLSGDDDLGGGRLELTLKNGKLNIDPLDLRLPGGSIHLDGVLEVDENNLTGQLRAKMENFDIGVLARRTNPKATFGGLINLDMNIKGSGIDLKSLVEGGSGYMDFSGQLNNIESGAVDLWAVNLVRAVLLGTAGVKSYINCGVGRWSARDGLLTADTFFIDTTGIRICGIGQVDLANQRVDMLFSPVAKRPQFYSPALPVAVKGSFDNISFRLPKTETIGAAITLLTSPVHVPLQRILESAIPADGRDACLLPLGPDDRNQRVQGCFRKNRN